MVHGWFRVERSANADASYLSSLAASSASKPLRHGARVKTDGATDAERRNTTGTSHFENGSCCETEQNGKVRSGERVFGLFDAVGER